MGRVGVPEMAIILFITTLVNLVPIAIAVWLIVTVVRLRTHQKVLEARLEAFEHGARQP